MKPRMCNQQNSKQELQNARKIFLWNEKLFSFFGVNPVNFNNIYHACICSYIIIDIIFTVLDINENLNAKNSVASSLTRIISLSHILGKFTIYKLKHRILADILNEILSEISIVKFENEREIRIFVRYLNKAKIFFKYIIPVSSAWVSLYYFRNLLVVRSYDYQTDRECLHAAKYLLTYRIFLHHLKECQKYLGIYVLGQLLAVFAGFAQAADSGMLIAIIMYVCGKIAVLSECKLKNLFGKPENFQLRIKEIVRYHNGFLGMVKRIESTYSLLLLQQTISITLYLSIIGYYTTMYWNHLEIKVILLHVLSLTTTLCILFSCCYAGQCLINESFNLFDAIYDDAWYELKPEHMKYYIVLLQRTKKPLFISAGGLFPCSHETFINVAKTGLAYLSVLRAINKS